MMKALVIALAFVANWIFQGYAYLAGKIPDHGKILGITYHSSEVGTILFTFKYIWLLALGNILFAYAAKNGSLSFESFISFLLIWIAVTPVAALIFNMVVSKSPINGLHLAGVLFIIIGSAFIVANKEILALCCQGKI